MTKIESDTKRAVPTIEVWDLLVRILHWTMAAAFSVAYITQTNAYETHLIVGYVVLGALAIRLAWGFVGSRHARFKDFLFNPLEVAGHLRTLFSRNLEPARYLGHNPAGGAMVLFLLVCLAVITLSGVALDAAENRAGPLSELQLFLYTDLISQIHDSVSKLTLGLIVLHILGVIVMSVRDQENLVRSMLTGKKHAKRTR